MSLARWFSLVALMCCGCGSATDDTAGTHAEPGGSGGTGGTQSRDGGATSTGGTSNTGGAGVTGGTTGAGGIAGTAGTAGTGGTETDSGGSWWKPTADRPIHWHWQLSQDFVYPRDVLPNKKVFDIDGELSSADTVTKLHALGSDIVVICYFDAGVYEDYRSDAASFPKEIIGKADTGWTGSYWLDVRQLDKLMPILQSRAQRWCKDKGFDAVEPDETEVWSNDSGFPITKAENNAFNQAVAGMVHSLGMSVGLKGNNTEAPDLYTYFDWALTEQCWEYSECDLFRDSFVAANKAVLNVEYGVSPDCTLANSWHINSSRRDLDLVGPTHAAYLYQPCIPDTQDTW